MKHETQRGLQGTAPVAVIIVNWNSGNLLEHAVSALLTQTVLPHEIIVVDNASADNSIERIITKFPEIRVIKSSLNLGFAAANNLAFQAVSSTCEWIALLNPDAFPETTWLEFLLSAAARHPEYAFFGSLLINADSPNIVDGAGDTYHISGLVWRRGHRASFNPGLTFEQEIFSPCAAAAMFRKDALLAVGGFDEDFFCYVEDVDLGFRLRLMGYRALYVPDSVALHVGSATTGRGSEFSIYYGQRNLIWTFVKNMPGTLFLLLLPLHILLNIGSILWYIWHGQGSVILRAKRDALLGLHKMWRKRRIIQNTRVASIPCIWRMLDKRVNMIKKRSH